MVDKKDKVNRAIVAAGASLVTAGLVAHTGIPWVAITSGVVAGLASLYGFMGFKSPKALPLDIIPAVVGSQMGWAALLI